MVAKVLMLGCAWQQGPIPLSEEAILPATELSGAAIETNKRAWRAEFDRVGQPDANDLTRGHVSLSICGGEATTMAAELA